MKVIIYKNSNDKTKEIEKELRNKLESLGLEEDANNYDLALSIGGDGTFLKMVNETGFREDIYYVGINTGTLGFLQELTIDDYKDYFKDIINGNISFEEQVLEEIEVTTTNNTYHYLALNEIVIRRKDLRVLESKVIIDSVVLEDYAGDGLLISTNVGSTAYNMSLGGSIIDKHIKALILTPMAPLRSKMYRSLNNAIVLDKKRVIEIKPITTNVILTIDGINKEIDNVINIQVKLSEHKIKCLKKNKDSFIKIVHERLVK